MNSCRRLHRYMVRYMEGYMEMNVVAALVKNEQERGQGAFSQGLNSTELGMELLRVVAWELESSR